MKYKISLQAVHPMIKDVIIEAENEFEADEIALQMAQNNEIDWIYCDSDCIRDFEVIIGEDYEGEEEADNIEGDEDE